MNQPIEPKVTDAAKMSKMLWSARESIEMWADVVEIRAGKPDVQNRALVAEIDEYRKSRGWSMYGFGNETDPIEQEELNDD